MTQPSCPTPRERLLEVAGRLFYAEGIHAVGVDRVVTAAGVAKATLYAHFAGKDELVAAYLAERSAAWQVWAQTVVDGAGGGPRERILALFDALGERFAAPGYRGCPFINAGAEYPAEGVVADQVRAHRLRVRALLDGLVRALGAGRTDTLTDGLMILYDGAMVTAQLDAGTAAAAHARAAAERMLATV